MVAMRSQQTGLDQKKKERKKKERKINTNERKKNRAQHPWYLMLIAVAKDCL